MKATNLRAAFLQLVERFNAGELDVSAMWDQIEVLNRAGVSREFREGEEARAVSQLRWALDKYDSTLPSRPGLAGRIVDTFDAAFRNEYRIGAEELKAKAIAVERIMKRGPDV